MVNWVLKRLAHTGYVKATTLDRNKVRYVLTSKGFLERLAKSLHYVSRAVRTYRETENRLSLFLQQPALRDVRRFFVVGENEMADLLADVIQKRGPENQVTRLKDNPGQSAAPGVVLDCRLPLADGPVGITVLESLLGLTSAAAEPPGEFSTSLAE